MKEIILEVLKEERDAEERLKSARKEAEKIVSEAKKKAQLLIEESKQKINAEVVQKKTEVEQEYLAEKENILRAVRENVNAFYQKKRKDIPKIVNYIFQQVIKIDENT